MSAVATRPQIASAFNLARSFGHWWADCARLVLVGPAPTIRFGEAGEDSDRAAFSAWAARCNAVTGAQVAARFGGMAWDAINAACEAADDRRDDHWSGGVAPASGHETQSGTLAWDVALNGTVTFTARRRGSRAHPAIWWTATVYPGGAHTITAHEGAPSGPGDRWEEDHGQEYPQRGEYTWNLLRGAIAALGGAPPPMPPLPPRQFTPLRGGSRRSMAAIA